MKTVCFTGHRPDKLGGYDEQNPLAMHVKGKLEKHVLALIEKGFTRFISGGAIGVDTWAAEIVLRLRESNDSLHLTIARPFPSQAGKWNDVTRARFEAICSKADHVVDVSPDPYEPWKMQKRNEWMVDHSNFVLAVWDRTPGGTSNCVKYAMKQNKPVAVVGVDYAP
jgi:uncharacterized phage-like protein YoqJ